MQRQRRRMNRCGLATRLLLGGVLFCALGSSNLLAQVCDPVQVGASGGGHGDLLVSGDTLYAMGAGSTYGLQILDVSDPTDPVLVSSYFDFSTFFDVESVALSGTTLFANGAYFLAFDVSDPANPVPLSSTPTVVCCAQTNTLVVEGNIAYFAGGRFAAMDVTDPTAPVPLGNINVNAVILSLAIEGSHAFVVSLENGLQVIDISNPASPTLLSTTSIGAGTGLTVGGGYAYVATGAGGGLEVYDVSDPAAPFLVATVPVGDPSITPGIYEVVLSGTKLVGKLVNSNGIAVFDVSDPTNPIFETFFGTGGGANGDVEVQDGLAYTSTGGQITIFDASSCGIGAQPTTPYQDAVLADSPVSYWSFEETSGTIIHDQQGLNDGTLVGAPILDQPGSPGGGRAIQFASGGYVDIANDPSITFTDTFTIEMWINPSNLSNQMYIVDKNYDEYSVILGYQPGNTNFFQGGYINGGVASQMPVEIGNWYHVVYTKDANGLADNWRGYLNGCEFFTETANFTLTPNPNGNGDLHLGSSRNFFNYLGYLDEVAVYDYALNAGSVAAHYEAATGMVCPVDAAPTANAGPDFAVNEGQPGVTLDGSASNDPDNDILTYAWTQLAGTTVTLSDAAATQPTFDAPLVALGGETLSFELTVTANGEIATDTVDVTIDNVDDDAPIVTITSPADGLFTNASDVTVDATIDDEDTTTVTSNPTGIAPGTLPVGGGAVSGSLDLLEGINDLIVSAEDASGNSGGNAVVVIRDTLDPGITISPAEGTIVSSPIPSFGIAVTDETNTDVAVNGTFVDTALVPGGDVYGVASIMLTGTIALWTEGANSIVVAATDAAGNTTTVTRTVILDSTAPLVEITTPSNGDCYGFGAALDIPLVATIDDATATEVTGALTGSLAAGGGTVTGTYTLVEGINDISVSAQDNAGTGLNATDTITVTLDTIAPEVEITTPDAGACVRGSIEFGATATDALPGAVESSTYFVDDVALTASELYVVDTTLLTDGWHSLRVDATDSCGNVTSTSIDVLVDNTAPVVNLTNPVDLDWVSGTIDFDGDATDNGSGLATVTMLAANAAPTMDGSQTYATFPAAESVSSMVDTLAATGGLDGDLELEVTARDCAGNETTVAITVQVDNTAPTKMITSPADGSKVRCEVRIQATADDANLVSVQFVIDGLAGDVLTNAPFETTYDTRTRLDGNLPITMIATDLAGNQTSCSINVTIDNLQVRIAPSKLQLKSRGGNKSAKVRVSGQSAALLAAMAPQDLTLCVPGGTPVPATLIYGYHAGWQCCNQSQWSHRGHRRGHRHWWHGAESRVHIKFDRRQLIGSLRGAGITSGKVELTLKASLEGETFVIGSDKIRVKGR